jgi:2-polyprenyl-6-methoxyphenol hydroxylase-like FAD-dependent oxidoreductase
VDDDLFARGAPFRRFLVCSSRGDELAEVSFTRIFEQAGCQGYVLHRGALHAAIAARVRSDAIRTGADVVSIAEEKGHVQVCLRDQPEPITGDLLIGADGLHSVVRRHVLGDGLPRYAGETIFRGIADFLLDRPEISRELFGAGRRAAYYELGQGRVYWWATAPLAAGTDVPQGRRRAYLEEAFAGWACDIPAIIAHTPEDRILQNDIFDRTPARRWHRGRAVLLGDAAHPTTPNLGQGACMAIEDAVVLARAIAEAPDSAAAFTTFHRRRSRRTAQIVRMSRWWGRVGLWKHPALIALRDGADPLGAGRVDGARGSGPVPLRPGRPSASVADALRRGIAFRASRGSIEAGGFCPWPVTPVSPSIRFTRCSFRSRSASGSSRSSQT